MSLLRDATTIAHRNMIRIRRVPDVMVFVVVQPLMFVLLFAYVFGGSIDIPGGNYREFLIAGIFTQTVVFGATFTGSGLAEDMQKGLINRFRSLPMARSAVVAGRTISDVVYNALSIVVMSVAGLAVGWRIRGSILDAIVAYGLLLFFSYAFSWVMACIGLMVPTPEVVNNATFVILFPMTFIANTFVPSDSLPGVLKTIAEWNPVSTLTHAVRVRFGNIPAGTPEPTAWPLQNAMLYSLGFAVVLIVVFAPIATRLYQRTSK
ncbi:MAG: ABC transporter [Acidimicrobiales bacterium mtb01]|nr:ABC transporter permease [Actinomycetota bacterium]TEX46477.1 MAG: ABC transporter [Acidimicrobiales bacterium mtb01]